MAMKRKAADRTMMDQTGAQDMTSFGEDSELLDPAEQALLDGGNAADTQPPAPSQESETSQPAAERADDERPYQEHEPHSDQADGDEQREDLSDEQVRKLAPTDTVPAWSLMKERQENRALKRNLENLTRKVTEQDERWNRASERLRLFQERTALDAAAAARNADPEPDVKTDPEAHYQWELRQQRHALEALNQQQQVSVAQAQAAQHQAALTGLEQQYVLAGHPDYYERVNFLRQRRGRELELMGYADPAERSQIIANEAAMLVGGALRQGRNPAAVAHELSEQWGYRPAGAATSSPNPSAEAGNGSPVSAVDRIRDLQRKKAAATSLQAIPSRPADGPVTLEDIAEMDDEAYERYVDKNGGDLAALFRRA
jgi:hypothetical protein